MSYTIDIEKATLENTDYRRVLYTNKNQQLVLMSISTGDDIPKEIHPDIDQFIRFEAGNGEVRLGQDERDVTKVKDGSIVMIDRGTWHRVVNTGNTDLKLYSLYSPPEHLTGLVQKTKKETNIAKLPRTALFQIALELDMPSLLSYCKSNKRFNKVTCDNIRFWKEKIYNDFTLHYPGSDDLTEVKNYYKYIMKSDVDKRLFIASFNGNGEGMQRYVNEGGNGSELLYGAAAGGHLEFIKELFKERTPNITELNKGLELASKEGKIDVINYLISKGANDLDNALLNAVNTNQSKDLLQFFIDKGATDLDSALFYAVQKFNADNVEFLIDKGADYGVVNGLLLARDKVDAAKFLIGYRI